MTTPTRKGKDKRPKFLRYKIPKGYYPHHYEVRGEDLIILLFPVISLHATPIPNKTKR